MLEFTEIPYTQLKKAVISLNESGMLTTNIRHVGVKGPKLYDDVMTSIDKLPDHEKPELPETVINFYNMAMEFNEDPEEQEQMELNFDDDSVAVEPEPEPEDVESDPDLLTEEDIPVDTETPAIEAAEEKEVGEIIVKEKQEEINLDSKPKRTLQRKSKVRMTPKVENGILTITFKELNTSESFTLPDKENKVGLKPVRKAAIDFAKSQGATTGQCCAISKTLNLNGYYAR